MKISSLNLSKVNKAVTGITETVRKSKLLIDNISERVGKTNERISELIFIITLCYIACMN